MKFFKLILIFIFISNCALNKVVKHHGVHNLKKKTDKLKILDVNTNDVITQLGFPSTKSTFNNEVWIYLERKTTSSELKSLGRKKLLLNDVTVLEFNSRGMLVKKDFLSMDDMNNLKISKNNTKILNEKNSFVQSFLTSLRQKINDPLGMKKAK
jgi:outer membrane protein assembly factor BamE (lipoprotein component of BamABCDE complex)|tara:strand:- start:30 stop:491 length:462 start_codon:yes stop_codon:yes gene_type:complete